MMPVKFWHYRRWHIKSDGERNDDWTVPPLTQTFPEIISEFETEVFLKAVCEDKIIDSVRASLDSGTCQIGGLTVRPDYQVRGIGTLLMCRIETVFPAQNDLNCLQASKALNKSRFRLMQNVNYLTFLLGNGINIGTSFWYLM
jgi:hypothetical protein